MTSINWINPDMLWDVNVRVFTAILCGGIIGAERQLRGKRAGLRVCILVVLTTAFFITLAAETGVEGGARMLSAIVSGVGFLGAGVIFSQAGKISGITTATLIWALAAVGATIGMGYPDVALVATLTIMGVLGLVDFLEHRYPSLREKYDDESQV